MNREKLHAEIVTAIYTIPITISRGNADDCADRILAIVDAYRGEPAAEAKDWRERCARLLFPSFSKMAVSETVEPLLDEAVAHWGDGTRATCCMCGEQERRAEAAERERDQLRLRYDELHDQRHEEARKADQARVDLEAMRTAARRMEMAAVLIQGNSPEEVAAKGAAWLAEQRARLLAEEAKP